ncbi:MAG TPA: phosphoribosylamine--glycine ligase [Solimonas sp.]|nr:phosphoribosylamine--glycine ligase [Solimonas sp.]
MKVLVVGSGGREHALAWKIAQSSRVTQVLVAPGNAGTAHEPRCRNVSIAAEDIPGLLKLARDERVDLTVIGPEGPLAAGIVDKFSAIGLRCFGPFRAAAQLESSKAFAKQFLARHRIPTASYQVHTALEPALADVRKRGAPIVIKADGLAAGKGVVVAQTVPEAEAAVRDMLGGTLVGAAGARVVVEDFLAGEEASFIVVVSAGRYIEMASSQDHKRLGDGDAGPNTGGMGAYSPAPVVTHAVRARVLKDVIEPTLAGLKKDGVDYTGFLYAGLMIDANGAPRVLEFNCRLGDPETQPLMMRLKTDLVELLDAAVDGRLDRVRAEWDERPAVGVVMAAAGYPAAPRKGDVITGLPAQPPVGTRVFHAGTAQRAGQTVTSGGRVLCVCAIDKSVRVAQHRAYETVAKIHFDGAQYRKDIAWRALDDAPAA